jgi:uncharacterized membrane protein YbhN (UPF0104 family)
MNRTVRYLKAAWAWLRWPVSLAILWWLIRQNRTEFAELSHRRIDAPLLGLAFLLLALSITSTFVRWRMLVCAQGFEFPLRDAVRIGYVGTLLNYVAAGTMGADVAKAAMIASSQPSRRFAAAGTVLIDRVLGLVALLVMGSLAGLAATELSHTPGMRAILSSYHLLGLGGMAAVALVMLPVVTRNPLVRRIPGLPVVGRFGGELINAAVTYQLRPRVIVAAFLISMLGHAATVGAFYCTARAVDPGEAIPGPLEHAQMMPAAVLAGVIIPLPGGVGATEGAFSQLYKLAGATAGDGLKGAVAYRVLSIALALIGTATSIGWCRLAAAARTDSQERRTVKHSSSAVPAQANLEPAAE